ncbi:hypothetical protein E3N88_08987 [Mikania micrantha]|uniref:Protein kinase domain-containing protein n=1 Tax=Mikania micrantha TaxID=192012 RepID=A0A5N6PJU1_9ASTR|nr:hypothetical protein E3N88_08987 [Mikania micrantha]
MIKSVLTGFNGISQADRFQWEYLKLAYLISLAPVTPKLISKLVSDHDPVWICASKENLECYQELAQAQAPKFMVISCADSRVCPSYILGFQPGEAFVVRNVANLVPPFENGPCETNAALEFSVNALQVENILVTGHSCCGGIRALMSMEDEKNSSSFIKNWVVVGKAARSTTKATASNLSFDQQCKHCEKESINNSLMNLLTYPWVEERVAKGLLSLHGGYYDFVDCTYEKWVLDYQRGNPNQETGGDRFLFCAEAIYEAQAQNVPTLMAFSMTHLITWILVLLMPYVSAITFNLSHIRPQSENLEIVTEGETPYISNMGIELTPDDVEPMRRGRAGRARYIRPLHLWDKKSGQLASFVTNFTFVIDSNQELEYGGGITFFLAQNNSVITGGHALGLPVDNTSMRNLSRFVAVEFDTFWNSCWDPLMSNSSIGEHVGISISSLSSVSYKKWLSNVGGGGVCQAWIAYDSVSKNLTVSFTAFRNNTVVREDGLVHTVDLRKELPEWVIFGFSGGTEYALYQSQIVRSWSFSSSDLPTECKNIMVGLIVAVWVVIIFLVMLLFSLMMFKRKKNDVQMNKDFEMGSGPKRFSYHRLARSTGNFAENHKLGEGGFGGVYKDIKSSNVMLDSNFNPKLGDFGLAKLVEHEKGSKTTMLGGTVGYMAPECVVIGKASKESDVYSFGVVALEIASGRKSIVHMGEETQIRLVEWVWELYGTKTLVEGVDPRLGSDFVEEELKQLMIVGLWCAHPDPNLRPSMRQAIQVLNFEASPPTLPSKMPVATYTAPHTWAKIEENKEMESGFISKFMIEVSEESNSDDEFHDSNNDLSIIIESEIQGENFHKEDHVTNLENEITVEEIATQRIHKDHPIENIIGELNVGIRTRNQQAQIDKDEVLMSLQETMDSCLYSCLISQVEPKNVKEALKESSWITSMEEELSQFEKLGVWELVDCPEDDIPIGTRCVFKCKKDEKGIIVRNKARLAVQGFNQQDGIDYNECLSIWKGERRSLCYSTVGI